MKIKNPATIVVGIVLLLCVGLGVYGWLAIRNIDTQPFLLFFGTSVGPTLAAFLTYLRTVKVTDKVDAVIEQTNGILAERFHTLPTNEQAAFIAEALKKETATIAENLRKTEHENGDNH